MEFRPCIDIHNGKVKQIVGSSLRDKGNQAKENFVSEKDASYYADFYQKDGIRGGHIILLNPEGSEFYEATRRQAVKALLAYPGGRKPCNRHFLCISGRQSQLCQSGENGGRRWKKASDAGFKLP